MRENWQVQVKKLALAYGTGWEYIPGSEEAGSVLTDIFLEMEERNRKRYEKIWQRQELAFLQAVPECGEKQGGLSGALLVRAAGGEHARWVEEGAEAYILVEKGGQIRFATTHSLQLTSARLKYAVCRRGLSAWLCHEAEEKTQGDPVFFRPEGEVLARPVFRWYFWGLCNGKANFRFGVDFRRKEAPFAVLPGKWTVGDGEKVYPADWRQTDTGFFLEGSTPGFAEKLEREKYEVKLELSPGEELSEEWLSMLYGGFVLTEAEEELEPDLCVTESGKEGSGRVLPFGDSLEEASCCYFSCDRILAGEDEEFCIRFRESVLIEEKLPLSFTEESSKGAEKFYKKYPWMKRAETIQDWQAQETWWEYFNGKIWRILPGSDEWRTCCSAEDAGERRYQWKRPCDMAPCVVEGEEHIYIRLRLHKVCNAHALYYRKVIPVIEKLRFSAGERRFPPVGQRVPDPGEEGVKKQYLGFDREITPDNSWYVGEWCQAGYPKEAGRDENDSVSVMPSGEELRFAWEMSFGKRDCHDSNVLWKREIAANRGTALGRGLRGDRGGIFQEELLKGCRVDPEREISDDRRMILGRAVRFDRQMILGKETLFGREAFWVELDEDWGRNPISVLPNFVSIRQTAREPEGEGEGERTGENFSDLQIAAGAEFSLESRSAGSLEAVCLREIRCDKAGAPVLSQRQASEHYFAHFGRLLTPMDLELILQERYPLLQVGACVYREEKAELTVELKLAKRPGSRTAGFLTEASAEEMQSRLPEIRHWLESMISDRGPLWLRGCSISLVMT